MIAWKTGDKEQNFIYGVHFRLALLHYRRSLLSSLWGSPPSHSKAGGAPIIRPRVGYYTSLAQGPQDIRICESHSVPPGIYIVAIKYYSGN